MPPSSFQVILKNLYISTRLHCGTFQDRAIFSDTGISTTVILVFPYNLNGTNTIFCNRHISLCKHYCTIVCHNLFSLPILSSDSPIFLPYSALCINPC
jgi:hypothetical protein